MGFREANVNTEPGAGRGPFSVLTPTRLKTQRAPEFQKRGVRALCLQLLVSHQMLGSCHTPLLAAPLLFVCLFAVLACLLACYMLASYQASYCTEYK